MGGADAARLRPLAGVERVMGFCNEEQYLGFLRDAMLTATDTDYAPWYIVHSNDKKRARLNCISHLLSLVPYKEPKLEEVKLGKRDTRDRYDDEAALKGRRFIPGKY